MAIHGGQRPQYSTSIYVTFKVFQLINQLRGRLKPRVQASSAGTLESLRVAKHTRLSRFEEDRAFRKLEKAIPLRGHQAKHRQRDRVAKPQQRGSRSSLKPLPLGKDASGPLNTHEEEVQRYVV
jgi:hypothetical protein